MQKTTIGPLKLNQVYTKDCLEGLAQLPDNCAPLIIIDPPYFKIKGEFDYSLSFAEWLELHQELAKQCRRVITHGGTLFIYGHAKNIAYQQVIFDNYFTLENNITWEVVDRQTNRNNDTFRCFAPVTERLLFYSTGLDPWQYPDQPFVYQPILNWMLATWKKSGLSRAEVDEACGTKNITQYWFLQRNFTIPTMERYAVLQRLAPKAFSRPYSDLIAEYNNLSQEHEKQRRYFDNFMKLKDVMRFSQESNTTGKYDHETVKPEKLTRALILTCSRPGDLVLVPFAGSGTEIAMAVKEGRPAVGFDTDEKHADTANRRVQKILNTPNIFNTNLS